MSLEDDANNHLSRSLWMIPSRSAIVLENMVGKVNERVFVEAVARVLVG